MVAPYQFQRTMDEPTWRSLSRYIRDVKAIRDKLADAVFLGAPAGLDDVRLASSGGAVMHRVYRNPRTNRRVCIVTNNGDTGGVVTFEQWSGSRSIAVRVHQPGRSAESRALPATFRVPPERIAFVEELPEGAPAPAEPMRAATRPSNAVLPDSRRPFPNADFESGTLDGWQADLNWTVDDNSAGGWYSGWQGRRFAWSGHGGEGRMGKLRSPAFRLDAAGVEVSVAGWSDMRGRTADRWNYVTLNLEDGRELDRAYTPNTTQFSPIVLEAGGRRGRRVYIEAVDDAPESTFSMICIDDVRLWDPPRERRAAMWPVPHAIVLENRLYRLEIGRANGTIARIRDKVAGIEVIPEPRLSSNWRFSLPMRDAVPGTPGESWRNHEGNYIEGRTQRLTTARRTPGGLELVWAGPLLAADGRAFRAGVIMRVTCAGDALRFETRIINRTRYEIGEVYAPILGGLQGLGTLGFRRRDTELIVPSGDGRAATRPFRTFVGMNPFGVFGPEQCYAYPSALRAPWALLRAPGSRRSLYFGAHDTSARLKVLHLEMLPGVSGPRASGNWPRDDELQGRAAGVRMSWAHIAYHPAGRDFVASPVVLRCSGDEASGAEAYYRSWLAHRPAARWLDDAPDARELGRTAFARVREEAAEALGAGGHTLILTDWDRGGKDDGEPSMEPDPALGSWTGLRDAARACRDLGADLILEIVVNPVSPRSSLFRDVLRSFRCQDRWGVPQSVLGWGAPRVTAEALCAGERRVYLNTGHPGFRAWFVRRVERLAEAGVAGVRLVGFFPNVLDFNPTLGATPDRAVWVGAVETLKAGKAAARRHVPGFRILLTDAPAYLRADRAP